MSIGPPIPDAERERMESEMRAAVASKKHKRALQREKFSEQARKRDAAEALTPPRPEGPGKQYAVTGLDERYAGHISGLIESQKLTRREIVSRLLRIGVSELDAWLWCYGQEVPPVAGAVLLAKALRLPDYRKIYPAMNTATAAPA